MCLYSNPVNHLAQAIRCLSHLGHTDACLALIAQALEEARSVNETLMAANFLHVQAGLLAGRGEAAAALNIYQVGKLLLIFFLFPLSESHSVAVSQSVISHLLAAISWPPLNSNVLLLLLL